MYRIRVFDEIFLPTEVINVLRVTCNADKIEIKDKDLLFYGQGQKFGLWKAQKKLEGWVEKQKQKSRFIRKTNEYITQP